MSAVQNRPKVLNLRTDRAPSGALDCSRSGPWGNPLRLKSQDPIEREQVLATYLLRLSQGKLSIEGVGQDERDWRPLLRRPALLCHCAPLPCHAEALANIAAGGSYQRPELNDRVVIVCGGRDFADRSLLYRKLGLEHLREPIGLLVAGAARGADSLAVRWARHYRIPVKEYPADWTRHGRAAGMVRNELMLIETRENQADVIAFPGGRGTAHMQQAARKAGRKIIEIKRETDG